MLRDLIEKTRTCRRFKQDEPVSTETLRELVDLTRLTPSAGNAQPLRYVLSNDPVRNGLIFGCLGWAGHLKGWAGPAEGERPVAYLIILGDTQVADTFSVDHGIAAYAILLGARERGIAGCIVGSVQRSLLRKRLRISDRYQILLVIALGVPAEQVVIEAVGEDGNTAYWRDREGVHHVPKRALDDIILD